MLRHQHESCGDGRERRHTGGAPDQVAHFVLLERRAEGIGAPMRALYTKRRVRSCRSGCLDFATVRAYGRVK
jgi:hypothetical protein